MPQQLLIDLQRQLKVYKSCSTVLSALPLLQKNVFCWCPPNQLYRIATGPFWQWAKAFSRGAFGEPGVVDLEEEEATEAAWREELDLSVAKNGDSEKDDVVLVECEKGLFLKVWFFVNFLVTFSCHLEHVCSLKLDWTRNWKFVHTFLLKPFIKKPL